MYCHSMRQESKNDETNWNMSLFPLTNPTGMAICLFGKWLLTLCVSCPLQKSKINGAHATPCCIPNWLASDQTSEPLCAFSLTVNAARYFILNENSPEFNFPFLNWKSSIATEAISWPGTKPDNPHQQKIRFWKFLSH